MGTSMNLVEAMKSFSEDNRAIENSFYKMEKIQTQIDADLKRLNKTMEVL